MKSMNEITTREILEHKKKKYRYKYIVWEYNICKMK